MTETTTARPITLDDFGGLWAQPADAWRGELAAHMVWDEYCARCREQFIASFRASCPDAATLLREHDARAACWQLARAGKRYGADAEVWARRPIVRAAVALLAARLERRAAHTAACVFTTRFQAATLAAWLRNQTPAVAAQVAAQHGRVAELAAQRRTARLVAAVEAAADGLYRVSGSRWAGGDHTTRVTIGDAIAASGDSSRSWSSNGKWSGHDSTHRFTVRPTWLRQVEACGLAVCDGLLTLDAEPVPGADGTELFAAAWVEQGRGFALNLERGYIARSGATTYHGASAKAALTGLRRKLGQTPPRRAIDLERLERRYGTIAVTVEDATACGLCLPGIRNWCAAVGLDPATGATLRQVIAGYRLRPLADALIVIRCVVRSHREWERVLAAPRGSVRFDSEGGYTQE